jgi:hypothetical protein
MHTDISKTFARIRREQGNGTRTVTKLDPEFSTNVSFITRRIAKDAR